VPISGSKNAVLPILAACLLTDEECRLKNVPRLEDVATMKKLLEGMGVQIRWLDPQQLQVNAERLARSEVLAGMANKMRASFLLIGPLLARRGEARVPKPGGDDIGMRRVEQHLHGLRLMGAHVDLVDGEYVARADRLKGATIHLDYTRPASSGLLAVLGIYNSSGLALTNSGPGVTNLTAMVSSADAYFAYVNSASNTAGLFAQYLLNLDVIDTAPPAITSLTLPAEGVTNLSILDRFTVLYYETIHCSS